MYFGRGLTIFLMMRCSWGPRHTLKIIVCSWTVSANDVFFKLNLLDGTKRRFSLAFSFTVWCRGLRWSSVVIAKVIILDMQGGCVFVLRALFAHPNNENMTQKQYTRNKITHHLSAGISQEQHCTKWRYIIIIHSEDTWTATLGVHKRPRTHRPTLIWLRLCTNWQLRLRLVCLVIMRWSVGRFYKQNL